jgi:hypothetical protein
MILAFLALAALLFAFLMMRNDNGSANGSRSEVHAPSSSPQTATSVDEKEELVSRLEEILAIRERAYRSRDPRILDEIYTVDCPCRKSDSNAILELIKEDYVWVGGETSIRVRRTERVSERMWVIVADFRSEALRIETKSGSLIRSEPQGQDSFEFVLAKPAGATRWLLGRASAFEDG